MRKLPLELHLIPDDAALTHVRLLGRLDAAGAEAIGLRFTAAVAAAERPALVDFADVEFVASMGLRLLLSTARALRQKGAGLCLYAPRAEVREVLEDAAIDQLVGVAADLEDARRRLAG